MRSVLLAAVLALPACSSPEAAIREASASVVQVESTLGYGSGVIVYSEPHWMGGYRVLILTAGHVIDDALGEFDLVARHPELDAALIEAHSDVPVTVVPLRLTELRFAEDLWKVGYGHGEFWVSRGCASAPDRASTPLHPGDSGGAILDSQGRLVGLVTQMGMQVSPRSGVEVPANSLCWFIPILDLGEWMDLYMR